MIIQNATSVAAVALPGQHASENGQRAPAAPALSAPEPSPQQLKQAVASINQSLNPALSNLEFNVDPSTHTPVVKVVDSKTGDVIRQIPSKEVLAIAESIDQLNKGLLLSQKA